MPDPTYKQYSSNFEFSQILLYFTFHLLRLNTSPFHHPTTHPYQAALEVEMEESGGRAPVLVPERGLKAKLKDERNMSAAAAAAKAKQKVRHHDLKQ